MLTSLTPATLHAFFISSGKVGDFQSGFEQASEYLTFIFTDGPTTWNMNEEGEGRTRGVYYRLYDGKVPPLALAILSIPCQ